MKTRHFLLLFFSGLCVVGVSVLYFSLFTPKIFYTQNIADYGSDKYPLVAEIFLDKIPSNANVIDFSYYNYWNEDRDIYLELKFKTKEEMECYLTTLKDNSVQALQNSFPPENGKWFITEQNPYNHSYTDSFCISHLAYSEDTYYTGYRMDSSNDYCFCSFAIISFSYEELTTIQTYVSGTFQNTVNNHTPQYFIRFNVPIDEEYDRLHYLE